MSSDGDFMTGRSLVGEQKEHREREVEAKIDEHLGIGDLCPFTKALAVCMKIP